MKSMKVSKKRIRESLKIIAPVTERFVTDEFIKQNRLCYPDGWSWYINNLFDKDKVTGQILY